MPKKTTPEFLAVAFSAENNNGKFDKADTLIAAVIDSNSDGVVSIGDTVTFGSYPLNTDATAFGTFLHSDSAIVSVAAATTTSVEVGVADGTIVFNSNGSFESFVTLDPLGNRESFFGDDIDDMTLRGDTVAALGDLIGGPADPDTTAGAAADRLGNDGFVDVLIA